MSQLKTYDPGQISVIFGGRQLTGFAEDSLVEVERDEDGWSLHVGADGEGTRSKNKNRSGTVKVSLMQTSDSNDILAGFAASDELSNAGVEPLLVKDGSGRGLHAAEQAWVQKIAPSPYKKESGTVEWVIRTHELETFPGGN